MPRLLLLEDDHDSLEMLQLLLEAAGYECTSAPRTATALRTLERSAFDLVLSDLLVDSKDIAQSWRRIDELVSLARPAQIGLITAWPCSHAEANARGLAFVLSKPCARDTLFKELASTLELPPLTPEQDRVVRSYFRSLESQDASALASICTDDVVYELPAADPRFQRRLAGREAFLDFTRETFTKFHAPVMHVRAVRPLPGGALVEYSGAWGNAAERREVPGAVMFAFRGDRIAHIGVRVDTDRIP